MNGRNGQNGQNRPRVRHDWEMDDDRRLRKETLERILREVPRVCRPPGRVNRRRQKKPASALVLVGGAVAVLAVYFGLWMLLEYLK